MRQFPLALLLVGGCANIPTDKGTDEAVVTYTFVLDLDYGHDPVANAVAFHWYVPPPGARVRFAYLPLEGSDG